MGSEIIQAQYDQLEQVTVRFGHQAEATAQTMQRTQQSMRALQAGGWEGRGSAAFFAEMNGTVLPATLRLQQAMQTASEVTRQIIKVIQQAEQDAAAPFKDRFGASVFVASMAGQDVTSAGNVSTPVILGQILKGVVADTVLPSRYVLRAFTPNLARSQSTVAMLLDMLAGKPGRGLPLIRFDLPHAGTNYPHINIEPSLSGFKDPHLRISPALLEFAGKGARVLQAARRIVLPAALIADVFRLGSVYHADGDTIGEGAKTAIGGVAGGWVGAFAGAKAGAIGGTALGGLVGSIFPVIGNAVGAGVGGFLGGLLGGIGGALGGNWLGEQVGERL